MLSDDILVCVLVVLVLTLNIYILWVCKLNYGLFLFIADSSIARDYTVTPCISLAMNMDGVNCNLFGLVT